MNSQFLLVIAVATFAPHLVAAPLHAKEMAAVKRAVSEVLKDPISAQFSNVQKVPRADGVAVVCGLVNARNSFGGYVGKQPFAVINYNSKAPYVELGEDRESSIETLCAPKTSADLALENARKKLETLLRQEDEKDEVKHLCSRLEFSYASSDWCGQLYVKCWDASKDMSADHKTRFMNSCRRAGFNVARDEASGGR